MFGLYVNTENFSRKGTKYMFSSHREKKHAHDNNTRLHFHITEYMWYIKYHDFKHWSKCMMRFMRALKAFEQLVLEKKVGRFGDNDSLQRLVTQLQLGNYSPNCAEI